MPAALLLSNPTPHSPLKILIVVGIERAFIMKKIKNRQFSPVGLPLEARCHGVSWVISGCMTHLANLQNQALFRNFLRSSILPLQGVIITYEVWLFQILLQVETETKSWFKCKVEGKVGEKRLIHYVVMLGFPRIDELLVTYFRASSSSEQVHQVHP